LMREAQKWYFYVGKNTIFLGFSLFLGSSLQPI